MRDAGGFATIKEDNSSVRQRARIFFQKQGGVYGSNEYPTVCSERLCD